MWCVVKYSWFPVSWNHESASENRLHTAHLREILNFSAILWPKFCLYIHAKGEGKKQIKGISLKGLTIWEGDNIF